MNNNFDSDSIYRLLKLKKTTQKSIAAACGLSGSAITKWKRGLSEPRYENLVKISEYFSVPVEFFFKKQRHEKKDQPQQPQPQYDLPLFPQIGGKITLSVSDFLSIIEAARQHH